MKDESETLGSGDEATSKQAARLGPGFKPKSSNLPLSCKLYCAAGHMAWMDLLTSILTSQAI